MCILESLLLKTPQIWPISDPTPTLTGVSNQKTSVFASEYTKNNSPKVVLKDTESVLFCVKKRHQKTTKNTLIYRYRKRTIKSPMKSENNA